MKQLLDVLFVTGVCLPVGISGSDSASDTITESDGTPTTTVSSDATGDAKNVYVGCNARDSGVDLTGCDLTGSTLTGASLVGDDLTRANLEGVDMTNADLYDDNLTGADLENANLTGADLTGVMWSNTTCPNGQVQSIPCV
jgi:uncharacterized protein YjbI with pentapeptide repeats